MAQPVLDSGRSVSTENTMRSPVILPPAIARSVAVRRGRNEENDDVLPVHLAPVDREVVSVSTPVTAIAVTVAAVVPAVRALLVVEAAEVRTVAERGRGGGGKRVENRDENAVAVDPAALIQTV